MKVSKGLEDESGGRRSTYSCVHCSGKAGTVGAGVVNVTFASVLLGSMLVSDGGASWHV